VTPPRIKAQPQSAGTAKRLRGSNADTPNAVAVVMKVVACEQMQCALCHMPTAGDPGRKPRRMAGPLACRSFGLGSHSEKQTSRIESLAQFFGVEKLVCTAQT